eukprot:TRINITY_DN2804_c0_g1_i2.p2 TRINITY_DN2804_c0_g1~~TRINITY_DN2804_c0_g1_i2.p2  ORF type:complete len:150 (+),score=5.40 TRINITY_DN2804_c0_g1_i2:57-452(+)
MEIKLPAQQPEKLVITDPSKVPAQLWDFMQRFETQAAPAKEAAFAQGLFGYTCFDAVSFFDTVQLKKTVSEQAVIPLMRYRLYQYVIVFNHFKDELYICENRINVPAGKVCARMAKGLCPAGTFPLTSLTK